MAGHLISLLGGENVLESKTRDSVLIDCELFEYGEPLAASACFGLDFALPFFVGNGAAYAMLAVSNAVVDVMVIYCDLIIIPLPLFPVSFIFWVCWKLFSLMRWRLVGKWKQ